VKNNNTERERQSSLVSQRTNNCSSRNSKSWVFLCHWCSSSFCNNHLFLEIREFSTT